MEEGTPKSPEHKVPGKFTGQMEVLKQPSVSFEQEVKQDEQSSRRTRVLLIVLGIVVAAGIIIAVILPH